MATITKRGNSYRIRVSAGYDVAGKQIMKSITWTPELGMTPKQIEKELERQKVLFEEKCKSGQYFDSSTTFEEFTKRWIDDYAEKQLKIKTVARYKSLLIRINKGIGHIKLVKLQPQHLISFYNNLSESGIRGDGKYKCKINLASIMTEKKITKATLAKAANISPSTLHLAMTDRNISPSSAEGICKALEISLSDAFVFDGKNVLSAQTILHYHRLISSILSTAVHWQIIPSNPCQRVKPPRVERKEARYLDENESARLLELLEKEDIKYRAIIHLLLYTGMRRGELCGLEWKDIDFSEGRLYIRRSSLYTPEKGLFTDTPKNTTSERSIKLSVSAIAMLKSYKAWQAEYRLKLGDKWSATDRLFTNWCGEPIRPDTVSAWFYHFIEKTDLPKISIHSLRHTNATLQIMSGVPLRTVSDRLGHAKTSTTANIYAHAIRSSDEAAAEALDNILNPQAARKA